MINDLDFPTTTGYTKKDVKKVQSILLEMAKIACRILEFHKIPYFITNGTLLGAVRHKAFIPWDDDFDIFLFDDTYQNAIRCLKNDLPEHLIIHSIENDTHYFHAWNRVKNLKTKIIPNQMYHQDNNILKYQCLSIDLYRIKKMKEDDVENYKITEALEFFKRKLQSGLIDNEEYNKNIKKLNAKLNKLQNNKLKKSITDIYMFMLLLKKPLHPRDIFPLREYCFEDTNFLGPNNYKNVLTSLYGDYRTIPEYRERKTKIKRILLKK